MASSKAVAEIPYVLVHQRLVQAAEMRAFSIKMLLANPHLAAKAGPRVQAMLVPLVPISSD